MGWELQPHAGFCEVAGELVFLDLARDKYLALRGADRAAFERLRRGEANDSDAMTRLVATGLFHRSNSPAAIRPAAVDIPARDLSAAASTGFSLAMMAATARALWWARREMRSGRIAGAIAARRERRAHLSGLGDERAMETVAARYAENRWIHRTPPRCLIDALALDDILLSRGLGAVFVFGVRMAPFKAHCWLQTSSTILTGTAAEARNFTPILVVR